MRTAIRPTTTLSFLIGLALSPKSSSTHGAPPAAIVATQSDSLKFTAVSASGEFACGLTALGEAYCWGANDRGSSATASKPAACARCAYRVV